MHSLGRIYEAGNGVEKDAAKAAGFYRQAAEKGSADAQFQLGPPPHSFVIFSILIALSSWSLFAFLIFGLIQNIF